MASTYSWKAAGAGSWASPGNWIDLTTGSDPAASAPAAGEAALIAGSGGTITGPGTSALASFAGAWTLDGVFRFTTLAASGGFAIAAGSAVTAGTVTLAGTLSQSGALTATTLDLGAATLLLQGAAALRASAAGLGSATIQLAGGALLEIGNLGTGAAGVLTVDAGIRAAGHDFTLIAAIANAGTIATDGSAAIQGAVGGPGVLEIGAGASLRIAGSAGAGQDIRLAAGATLDLAAGSAAGWISGLLAGSAILLPAGIDGASYVPVSGALSGRLSLTAGGTPAATLDLRGDYAGRTFSLGPSGGGVALGTDAPAARTLQWNAASGSWQTAANWTDTGAPAASPPGGNDRVTVAATAAEIVLTGPGAAATLDLQGNVALTGTFAAGTVAFRPWNQATDSQARLAPGATLATNGATVSSTLLVDGATLDVAGTLALATDGPPGDPVTIGQLVLAGAARMRVDTLDLAGHFGLSTILLGGLTIAAGAALVVGTAGAVAGALAVQAGHTVRLGAVIDADVVNDGTLLAEGFAGVVPRIDGAVGGSGTIALASALFDFGAGLELAGAVGAGQTLVFGGPNQTLSLGLPAAFAASIAGFTRFDTIALPAAITAASFAPDATGGVLSLFAGAAPAGSLAFLGDLGTAGFALAAQGGMAVLTTDVPCFAAGTRIATPRGPAPVEALRPGDLVLTHWGEALPVRWLGHRRIACHRHPRPHDVLPVRIRAGAFGPGLPCRDLRLSPDHAVFSDGALVPVRYLLNGATVVQEPASAVTYFHVELDRHDVLLAEDLPCESYLDTGNRAAFANGGPAVALHADFAGAWDWRACGRLVTDGPALAVLRARLFEQALALGHRVTTDPALRLDGAVARRHGDWHLFRLPPGMHRAVLRSRSVVPDQIWPGQGDHRRLGIAIRQLRLDGRALRLDDRRLADGWHAPEPGLRWTGGAAEIALSGARRLAIEAPALLDYWAEGQPGRAIRMSSPSTFTS